MSEERTEGRKRRGGRRVSGMILQIIVSVLCVLVGALLLFVPEMQIRMLCYIFCAGLIVTAIVEIARFFLSEAYTQLSDYSFAVGVLCLILGICGLLRISDLTEHFELYLGFIALAIGTVILQEMVQLKVLDNLFWVLLMIFNAAVLAGAIMIIVNVQPVLALIPQFTYWVLFVAGCASLLSLLITAIVLYLHRKKRSAAILEEEQAEAVEAELVPDEDDDEEEEEPAANIQIPDAEMKPESLEASAIASGSTAGDGWVAYPDLFDAENEKNQ